MKQILPFFFFFAACENRPIRVKDSLKILQSSKSSGADSTIKVIPVPQKVHITLDTVKDQRIHFESSSSNYRLADTIKFKINNTSKNKLYYTIGGEVKVENEWKAFTESILDFPSMSTGIRSIQKGQIQIKRIGINNYLSRIATEKNSCDIKLILHYGINYKQMDDESTIMITIRD